MHIPPRCPAAVLRSAVLLAFAVFAWALPTLCQQAPIQLPSPQITGGLPLMQALAIARPPAPLRTNPPPASPLQPVVGCLWRQPPAPGQGRPRPHRALRRRQPGHRVGCCRHLGTALDVHKRGQSSRLRPVVAGDLRGKIGASPACPRSRHAGLRRPLCSRTIGCRSMSASSARKCSPSSPPPKSTLVLRHARPAGDSRGSRSPQAALRQATALCPVGWLSAPVTAYPQVRDRIIL